VALHVESEGRAAALAGGALWAVFDARTACGESSGDGGDEALSLVYPLRTVQSLYGMQTRAVHILSILRRWSTDPRVICRVDKPALSRLQASDRAQSAVLSPHCSLLESRMFTHRWRSPSTPARDPVHQDDKLQAAAAPQRQAW
jgi:hypothetical protein